MSFQVTAISIGVAGVAVGAGSGLLSYYGQQQAASNAQAVADYNYKLQQRQNAMQAAILNQQSAWQQQALANNRQSALNNASALNNEARAVEARAREETRRQRQANERELAKQRARYAKAGVTTEGSPLMIMAESAGLLELSVQDAEYKARMEAGALDRKATLLQSDADNLLFDAGVAEYETAAQRAGLKLDLNAAKIDKMSGYSQASGLRMSSYGSLLSGVGDSLSAGAGAYDSYKRWKS